MPDLAENAANVAVLARAARRAAATIATDPEVRHYSPDTIALVLKRTIYNYVGAGSWDKAAEKLSNDPEMDGVPIEAIVTISKAALVHFARALSDRSDTDRPGPIGPSGAES